MQPHFFKMRYSLVQRAAKGCNILLIRGGRVSWAAPEPAVIATFTLTHHRPPLLAQDMLRAVQRAMDGDRGLREAIEQSDTFLFAVTVGGHFLFNVLPPFSLRQPPPGPPKERTIQFEGRGIALQSRSHLLLSTPQRDAHLRQIATTRSVDMEALTDVLRRWLPPFFLVVCERGASLPGGEIVQVLFAGRPGLHPYYEPPLPGKPATLVAWVTQPNEGALLFEWIQEGLVHKHEYEEVDRRTLPRVLNSILEHLYWQGG